MGEKNLMSLRLVKVLREEDGEPKKAVLCHGKRTGCVAASPHKMEGTTTSSVRILRLCFLPVSGGCCAFL